MDMAVARDSAAVEALSCCSVYTVITNDYDPPPRVSPNASASRCNYLLLHDGRTKKIPFPWQGVTVRELMASHNGTRPTPAEDLSTSAHLLYSRYTATIRSRIPKIIRPPPATGVCQQDTIYVDSNVGIHADPWPLLHSCMAPLCMLPLGRSVSAELKWLLSRRHASPAQYAELRREYAAFLPSQLYYGKIIVRRYANAKEATERLVCFERAWFERLTRPGAVQRDQVHEHAALAACNLTVRSITPRGSGSGHNGREFTAYFTWHRDHARSREVGELGNGRGNHGKALSPSNDSAPATIGASALPKEPPVHVVVGADREHWAGVVGVVNSLIANTASPGRLRVLAVTPLGLERAFCAYLRCQGLYPHCSPPPSGGSGHGDDGGHDTHDDEAAIAKALPNLLRVVGFSSSRLPPKLHVRTKLTNLESPLNFARFFLDELLPAGTQKALYLDADTIVLGDACSLYDASLSGGDICAATPRRQVLGDKGVSSLKGKRLLDLYRHRYGADLPLREHGFNAGVFVFNLDAWRRLNLTAEVMYWIKANNNESLYQLGSQPPLTLAVYGARNGTGRCQALPAEWHLDCLGCLGPGRLKTKEQLVSAKLLHWNGPNKPFATRGRKNDIHGHYELFKPYEGRGSNCSTRETWDAQTPSRSSPRGAMDELSWNPSS